jgi:hypothetical protein
VSTNVFLFIGDSNAVGYQMSAGTLPPELAGYNYGSTYVFGQGASYWGAYTPGVNSGSPNSPGAWGPEAEFLKRVHDAHPADINLVIKVAHGSTTIAQDGALLDWSPASSGEMFDIADSTIDAARAAFQAAQGVPMPAIGAAFFVDGPNAAVSSAKAAAYETDLTDFLSHVRSELVDDASGYIGFTRMTDSNTATPYNFDVRLAQWNVDQADAHAESFKTIGMGMQIDGIHYSVGGYVSVGDAFYDNWAA